jgi:alpha-glucosidase
LETHTISISAIHYNEDDAVYLRQQNGNLTELNVHSLNGFLEGIATKNSLERTHKTSLTFILSRSSFMGSGRFVQHWLGDNQSTWEWLASSVSAIFGFNLYGIPFVGDDVCGFGSDTNDQLCARWIQLAAFYPFARSHDAFDARIQEPWTFQPYVVEATRKSLNLRYSLLKFYYA